MRPLLFIDFHGTLCQDRFWNTAPCDVREKVQSGLFNDREDLLRKWTLGECDAEYVHRILSHELDIEYEPLWNAFVHDCTHMSVESSILDQIHVLKSRYAPVLITDNMDSFRRFTVPALKLMNHFDQIVCSYEEKMSKNDRHGTLFLRAVNGDAALLAKSILIDDSENVCQIFESLGGTAYRVTKGEALLDRLVTLDV